MVEQSILKTEIKMQKTINKYYAKYTKLSDVGSPFAAKLLDTFPGWRVFFRPDLGSL